jgi:hypothetical protein
VDIDNLVTPRAFPQIKTMIHSPSDFYAYESYHKAMNSSFCGRLLDTAFFMKSTKVIALQPFVTSTASEFDKSESQKISLST